MRRSDQRPPGHYSELLKRKPKPAPEGVPHCQLVFSPNGRVVGFRHPVPTSPRKEDKNEHRDK